MPSNRHADLEIDSHRCAELLGDEGIWRALRADDAQNVQDAWGEAGYVPLALVSGDDVLWKLSLTEGGTPVLDLSKTPKSSGSAVIIDSLGATSDPSPANWTPARVRVFIDQTDLAGLATTKPLYYFDELILKDSADTNRLKPIVRGRVKMRPSQGGNT